jgi:hypothetical protein
MRMRAIVPCLCAFLAAVAASCGGSPRGLGELAYEERFASLAANGWTDTADPAQFPVPPAGYSFTLDGGRYLATSSIQAANSPSCVPVRDGGADLAAGGPYAFRYSVAFPVSNAFIADSFLRFNYYRKDSFESYDYLALRSDGLYHVGHYDSAGSFYHYTEGWMAAPSIETGGGLNEVDVEQGTTSFDIGLNGVRICYAVNRYLPSADRGFHIGIMRDAEDLASVGSVSAYYDDIELYN